MSESTETPYVESSAPESQAIVRSLTHEEIDELFTAKRLLENPGLAAKVSNVIGAPIERGLARLPKDFSVTVNKAARAALFKALEVACRTLKDTPRDEYSDLTHKVMVGTSGWIGGAFGFLALAIELPISTTIMLRSIADIARSEGHDLGSLETRLTCLEVFALTGSQPAQNGEGTYWVVRATLTRAVAEAVTFLTERRVLEKSAPAIVRLIGTIAARFGVVISEQAAAKAIPIIGAASGSVINVLFMDHFQNMARGHFIVKRLEKKYGTALVRDVYASLAMPVPV